MTLEDTIQAVDSADGWVFAFEGGAHVLFRHIKSPSKFAGKLLRLAKKNTHTLSTSREYQSLRDIFLPLLEPNDDDEHVVRTELVRVTYELLKRLQKEQVVMNTKRGSVLDLEERHGTIVDDLSSDPSMVLLEFKPKWLAQSPTAPKNANTCRTCALRRLREKQPKAMPRFCPLDLASGRWERIYRAVTALLSEKSIRNTLLSSLITDHLLLSPLIPRLLKAQTCPVSSLATKMTVRDCTLFILVPRHLISDPKSLVHGCPSGNASSYRHQEAVEDFPGSGKIRTLVADLDEKSEKQRGDYWRDLEDQLINGGYYLGKGKMDVNAENCDFSDNVTASDKVKWDDCTMSGCVIDAYVANNGEIHNGTSNTIKRGTGAAHKAKYNSVVEGEATTSAEGAVTNGNGHEHC